MEFYRITIHCSDTPNGAPVSVEAIREYHMAKGWHDIGYHYVLQPTGELQQGRPLDEQGAHVAGANEGNLGICLVGRDKFTKQQFVMLENFVWSFCASHRIPLWEIYCHNQFPSAIAQGKTCPNISINKLSYFIATGEIISVEKHLYAGS